MSERKLYSLFENLPVIELCDSYLEQQITDLLNSTNIPDIMWPNMLEYIQAKIRLRITEREVEAYKQRRLE